MESRTCISDMSVSSIAQWCLTFWNSMVCSPPSSSVHGIIPTRILSGLPFPFPGESSQLRDGTLISYSFFIASKFFTTEKPGIYMTPSCPLGFPGDSNGKNICLKWGRPGFDPWVRKISCRRTWQPTPVLSPGKFHGWRSLVGYSPWGCKDPDTTERLHFHFSLSCIFCPHLVPK